MTEVSKLDTVAERDRGGLGELNAGPEARIFEMFSSISIGSWVITRPLVPVQHWLVPATQHQGSKAERGALCLVCPSQLRLGEWRQDREDDKPQVGIETDIEMDGYEATERLPLVW